jgi:hypothetical protein
MTLAHTELRSGDQTVHFEGQLLGKASSEWTGRGVHKPRWTEFEIYATDDDHYVIAKTGKSRIVHATQTCPVLRNNLDPLRKVDLDDPEHDWEWCDPNVPDWEQCWTDRSLNAATYGYLENDHATVNLADNPQGAIAACYSRDPQGVFSISWLGKKALQEAFHHDASLRFAYADFDIGQLGRRTDRTR